MRSLTLDLKHGLRMLAKTPGLSLLAILTLALGIGAATAIFSVVNGVLLKPLPYHDPDRLVRIFETNSQTDEFSTSEPNFLDMRAQTQTLADVAALRYESHNLTSDGDPQQLSVAAISHNLFPLLGLAPQLGSGFTPQDDAPGNAGKRVLLTDGLWRSRFGGDPQVVGRTLSLDGESYVIVGVMPRRVDFPGKMQAYVPLGANPAAGRAMHQLTAIGRLKPGTALAQARADMSGLALRLGQLYPDSNRNWGIRLITFQEFVVGASVTRTVWVLWGAVMLVLVMACANVANLLMAKATTRQHEVTVRLALGATRWRIIRQLLTESVLLSCAGGALGALLAAFGVDFLRSLGVENVPRLDELTVDGRVLAFAAVVAMGSAIAFGLAPALSGFSTALTTTAPRTTHRGRLISVLVSMEVALAMVLLVGAGLMMKSLLALTHVNPGFRTDHMLEVGVALPTGAFKPPQMMQIYRQIDEQFATLPGVDASGGVSIAPELDDNTYTRFIASGRPANDDEFLMANWRTTTPGFFGAMAIPLLQGRLLTISEFNPEARVCLINRKAAERFWPGENPLGKIVTPYARKELHYTVVGVVGDIRDVALNTAPDATVYLAGRPWPAMTYLLHTRGEPTALATAVRERVRAVNPNLPVEVRTLSDTLATSIAQPRFSGTMLTIFSWVALLLAMMGIFGVLSFSVAQKTREIGIRVALGAQRADVLRMVLGKGFRLAALGMAGGLAGALAGTRVLRSLLYDVRPTDPWVFAVVVLLLGGVALLASYLAARKALRVDPIIALRYE